MQIRCAEVFRPQQHRGIEIWNVAEKMTPDQLNIVIDVAKTGCYASRTLSPGSDSVPFGAFPEECPTPPANGATTGGVGRCLYDS